MNTSEIESYLRGYEGDRLAVEPEFGELLHDLVVDVKPEVIVEVGTGKGYSTCWMLLALEKVKDAKLYTVDTTPPDMYLWTRMNMMIGKLEVITGTLASELHKIPNGIGLAFLDSDHQIHNIVKDIDLILPLMKPGGKLVVHDVNYCRNMGDLLKDYFGGVNKKGLNHCGVEMPEKSNWEFYEEITRYSGLGIVTKKGE